MNIKTIETIDSQNNQNKINEENGDNEISIKYKNMLMNGTPFPKIKASFDMDNLDKFLENEKNQNAVEPWSKLDKTSKIKKLIIFAKQYKEINNLDDNEYDKLVLFFKDCLDRKKLIRVKDVNYDKKTGIIKSIPFLNFNKSTNNFTLKKNDKINSTTRSLGPKKIRGTIKNIRENEDDDDKDKDEDEDKQQETKEN